MGRTPLRLPSYTETEDITNWEETAAYIVYKDGTNTIAVNGNTGKEDSKNTNSSTVIQYCINQLTSGGLIFIKKGTYTLTTALSITTQNDLTLLGEGKSTQLYSGTDINLITAVGGAAHPNDLWGLTLARIYFKSIGASHTKIGISVDRAHKTSIRNCFFSHLYTAIDFKGSVGDTDNSIIINNSFSHIWKYGIMIQGTAEDNIVTGNYMDTSGNADRGIALQGIYNVAIGNTIEEIGKDAIYCSGLGNVIIGNQLSECSRYGINLGGDKAVVVGNVIDDNISYGIYGWGEAARITNNIITNNNASGIRYVVSNGSGTDVLIADNYFNGNGGDEISDATGNCLIQRNQGWVTENNGTATMLSGDPTIVVAHGLNGTPTVFNIAGQHSEVSDIYITTVGSANFTIVAKDGNTSADRDIYWEAKIR